LSDVAIEDTIAQGGDGDQWAGGGAWLGGGLFVGPTGTVTPSDVSFKTNAAKGGKGGGPPTSSLFS
jgi:hypothetical protein